MSKKRGVPVGYRHSWRYKGHWKETKIKPGIWGFKFTAAKTRNGAPGGGLRVGQSITWKIKGTQTATKVSGRTYKTVFKGSKILMVPPNE